MIDAPDGAAYLSDFLTELPVNCLFNKRQTGCGATELAIRNAVPTLIAMPYVALVKNKTVYRNDAISVLGVYEGIDERTIIDYARTHSPLKIIPCHERFGHWKRQDFILIKTYFYWWTNGTSCSTPIRSAIRPFGTCWQQRIGSHGLLT